MSKSVFEYLDYQHFLRDYVESQKKEHARFSYRYFAAKIEADHSNLVKIIQGKRHASKDLLIRMGKAMNFNQRELEYFKTMAAFNQAKNEVDTKRCFDKLVSIKNMSLVLVKPQQYEYYQKWYHTAIFTLIDIYDFQGDFRALAASLSPPISKEEAKASIELLEQLALIEKDKTGKYVHLQRTLTSGENWRDVAVMCYQEETLKLAIQSLTHHSKHVRDISTLSMSIAGKDVMELKKLVSDFRKNVIKLASESEPADCIYQLNIQLFPMTKSTRGLK